MSAIKQIILIDDNEADNFFHEIVIKRAGFEGEIVILESGSDALRYIETADFSQPTCIFLDINMPGMSGFDVAEQATPLLKDKPRVLLFMLTSSSSPADQKRAKSIALVRGYITKPLLAETVSEMLEEFKRTGQ